MGLITLLFLTAFSLLLFSRSFGRKPAALEDVIDKLSDTVDQFSFWAFSYGLAAFLLTLILPFYSSGEMLLRLVANGILVVIALPFVCDRLTQKYESRINATVLAEVKNFAGWLSKNEKILTYAGGLAALLLFSSIFM